MAMNPSYSSFLVTYVALLFLILSSHFVSIDAKKHKSPSPSSSEYTPPPPPSSSSNPNPSPSASGDSKTFNVRNYQQSGSYWTEAFQSAWKDACSAGGGAVVLVPEGTYLVKPTVFDGRPCKVGITFQVDGTIAAPEAIDDWGNENNNWLNFNQANGLQILGKGTIDGQAKNWWASNPHQKPTAVRIGSSDGVSVTGVNFVNSPQAHLKFDLCTNAKASGITITSPESSPNTDGIHIARSTKVDIRDMVISCGDDCISIGSGCHDITITKVTCNPSHGISIGSLGEGGEVACVSGITVTDCTLGNSDNGARIKSYTQGTGSVYGVIFRNLQLENVKVAMRIDQFYGSSVGEKGSEVSVHDVTFEGIRGTYTQSLMSLMCGGNKPCTGIKLSDISLEPTSGASTVAQCQHVSGTIMGTNSAGVDKCLSSETSADWWNYQYNSYVDSATDSCS